MTSLALVSVLLVAVPAFVFGSLFLYAIGDHIAHATAEAVAKAEMRALKSVDEGHEPFDPAVLGAAIPADMYVVITDPIDQDDVAAGTLPHVHPYGKVITGPSWHAVVHYENGPIVMVQLQATWALRGVAILLLVIVVMGCVAALFSRWLAGRSADRLIRPLDDLVETAEKIGSGDGTVMQRRYGLPELDRVATVLERTTCLSANGGCQPRWGINCGRR
jgi:nitrogen fixation/metabolism regulation signal transduction histidine kinase